MAPEAVPAPKAITLSRMVAVNRLFAIIGNIKNISRLQRNIRAFAIHDLAEFDDQFFLWPVFIRTIDISLFHRKARQSFSHRECFQHGESSRIVHWKCPRSRRHCQR